MKADELIVQFKIDDTELKKGYENLGKSNDKMEKSLESIEKKAEMTADKLFSLGKKFLGFIGAAIAANQSIGVAISEAKEIARLDEFASNVDSTIEDVNALNNTIISLGGEKDVAESNVSNLFNSIQDAAKDASSETARAFQKIGVSVKSADGQARDLFDTMGYLSQAVSRMDERKAKEFLKSLGITDRATVELMMKGRKEFEQMIKAQKESSPVNEESKRKALEFNKALGEMKVAFSNLKESMLVDIYPILEWFAKKLESLAIWTKDNKPLIISFFASIATALTAVYFPAIMLATKATLGLMASIAPLILAVAAFALVLEDVYSYLEGHDSMLGRTVAILRELSPAYADASDAFSRWIADFADSDDKIGMIKKLFEGIGAWALQASKEIGKDIAGIFTSMANTMISSIKSAFNDLFELIKGVIRDFEDTWAKTKDFFGVDGGGNYQKLLQSREAERIAGLSEEERAREVGKVAGKDLEAMYQATYGTVPKIGGGNEDPEKFMSKEDFEKQINAPKTMSMLDKDSIKDMADQMSNAIAGAALMPTIQSVIRESVISNNSRSSSIANNVRIEKIDVIAQGADVATLSKNIKEAIDKAFNDQFDDVIVQSSTVIV